MSSLSTQYSENTSHFSIFQYAWYILFKLYVGCSAVSDRLLIQLYPEISNMFTPCPGWGQPIAQLPVGQDPAEALLCDFGPAYWKKKKKKKLSSCEKLHKLKIRLCNSQGLQGKVKSLKCRKLEDTNSAGLRISLHQGATELTFPAWLPPAACCDPSGACIRSNKPTSA